MQANEWRHVQIERAANILGCNAHGFGFALLEREMAEVGEWQFHPDIGIDALHGLPVDHGKARSPDLMAPGDFVEAALQDHRVQRAPFMNGYRFVIGRSAARQLSVEPDLLLPR